MVSSGLQGRSSNTYRQSFLTLCLLVDQDERGTWAVKVAQGEPVGRVGVQA